MADNRDFQPESAKFRAWELPKRQQPASAERPASLPFEARSSHQDDYGAYDLPPRRAAVPPAKPPPSIPFRGRTVQQDDFQRHPIPRKVYITLEPAKR